MQMVKWSTNITVPLCSSYTLPLLDFSLAPKEKGQNDRLRKPTMLYICTCVKKKTLYFYSNYSKLKFHLPSHQPTSKQLHMLSNLHQWSMMWPTFSRWWKSRQLKFDNVCYHVESHIYNSEPHRHTIYQFLLVPVAYHSDPWLMHIGLISCIYINN